MGYRDGHDVARAQLERQLTQVAGVIAAAKAHPLVTLPARLEQQMQTLARWAHQARTGAEMKVLSTHLDEYLLQLAEATTGDRYPREFDDVLAQYWAKHWGARGKPATQFVRGAFAMMVRACADPCELGTYHALDARFEHDGCAYYLVHGDGALLLATRIPPLTTSCDVLPWSRWESLLGLVGKRDHVLTGDDTFDATYLTRGSTSAVTPDVRADLLQLCWHTAPTLRIGVGEANAVAQLIWRDLRLRSNVLSIAVGLLGRVKHALGAHDKPGALKQAE